MGHALRKAVGVLARQQGRELVAVAAEAGATLVAGSSLKVALDRNWDDPQERLAALAEVLRALDQVEAWCARQPDGAAAAPALAVAQTVRAHDVVPQADGSPALRRGVAPERRISVEDAALRHGRKSRSVRVDGYKRHAASDLDVGLVRAVGITPANRPEAEVADAIVADLAHQGQTVQEWHIDRGYLSRSLVHGRAADVTIFCKAWAVRNGERFTKLAFSLDWEAGAATSPNAQTAPFAAGQTIHLPAEACAVCPLRAACTSSASGRSVAIHADEQFLTELRQRQGTPAGRAQLRERVQVEHDLAHLGHWQGDRARYLGERMNRFDLRRVAVIHNLHLLQRTPLAA